MVTEIECFCDINVSQNEQLERAPNQNQGNGRLIGVMSAFAVWSLVVLCRRSISIQVIRGDDVFSQPIVSIRIAKKLNHTPSHHYCIKVDHQQNGYPFTNHA